MHYWYVNNLSQYPITNHSLTSPGAPAHAELTKEEVVILKLKCDIQCIEYGDFMWIIFPNTMSTKDIFITLNELRPHG